MAHTKAGGTVKNVHDSPGQRMGTKLYAGQHARSGNIIIRQRGMNIYPGANVSVASDHTLFATVDGVIQFYRRHKKKFNSRWVSTKFVKVIPFAEFEADKKKAIKSTTTAKKAALLKETRQETAAPVETSLAQDTKQEATEEEANTTASAKETTAKEAPKKEEKKTATKTKTASTDNKTTEKKTAATKKTAEKKSTTSKAAPKKTSEKESE